MMNYKYWILLDLLVQDKMIDFDDFQQLSQTEVDTLTSHSDESTFECQLSFANIIFFSMN